jgi:hypothetical protein
VQRRPNAVTHMRTSRRVSGIVALALVGCGAASPAAPSRTTVAQPQGQVSLPPRELASPPPSLTPTPSNTQAPVAVKPSTALPTARPTAGPVAGLIYPPAARLFPVTAYGARCNGVSDDTAAIRAAMQAASTGAGDEVTLPPGVCAVFANLPVNGSNPISISGAGQTLTFIVQHTPATGIFGITTPHVTIENVNLNTANANPGPFPGGGSVAPAVIYSAVSYTSVINVSAEVGDGFGMRITGPNPCASYQTTGTVVRNVNVTNNGSGGRAAIDIDCTNGAQISNITIHGQYLALYQDENVSVSGETYVPASWMGTCHEPWYITGPAAGIHIANVLSYGGAGIISPPTSNITITNQTVRPGC